MVYCWHHRAMDINHYVSEDVSSVEPADNKLHYTHHNDMDTLPYVPFDMSSNNTCQWMFYWTNRRYMGMLH
jgi:hypothetical protein